MQFQAGPLRSVGCHTKAEGKLWMHDFNKYMATTVATLSEQARKKALARAFAAHLKPNSPVDKWWKTLTAAQQADWDTILPIYNHKWCDIPAVEPDPEEIWEEFRAKSLSSAELKTRVVIPGTDDKRPRLSEYAEELEQIGARLDLAAKHLVPEALKLIPPGVAKLMRAWQREHPDFDWDDWCAHLGSLKRMDIEAEQELFDRAEENREQSAENKRLVEEQASVIAQQTALLNQIRRNQEQQRETAYGFASYNATRGRGRAYTRGAAPAPPPQYASREASPSTGSSPRFGRLLDPVEIDPNVQVGRRGASQPATPTAARTQYAPQTPAFDRTPRAASTPARGGDQTPRPRVCFRCGQEGHLALGCPNPPSPMTEIRARIESVLSPSANRFPPATPGTPSPAGRTRDVYNLDSQYDDSPDDFFLADETQEDREEQLDLMLAELQYAQMGEGKEFEAAN